jgi:hypothetical protein
MRSCRLFVVSSGFLLVACHGSAKDGGIVREDGTILDAGFPDEGARDMGPRPTFDGSFTVDTGVPPDASMRLLDGDVSVDIGPPGPGEVCGTALPWNTPDQTPIVAKTSTTDLQRDPSACMGTGAGADAPSAWWHVGLALPQHLIVRLGTGGFDGVLTIRTGTCAMTAQSCANAPPIVELPAANGDLFVGASAFSGGAGSYVLSAELGAPLHMVANTTCAAPQSLALPSATEAHDFGGTAAPLPGCAMLDAVYFAFTLASAGKVAIRVQPLAGQDVVVALLGSPCRGAAAACASNGGRGASETIGPLDLAPGTYGIAVGANMLDEQPGSFRLWIAGGSACVSDTACPIGQRCDPTALGCAPIPGFVKTSSAKLAIPDGIGSLDVPLDLLGPTQRPLRVRMRVVLDHPAPEDLVVELVAPPGPNAVRVRLRDRTPGPLDTVYGNDREADGPGTLEDFRLLSEGSGRWTLHIEDRTRGDSGFVSGYALEVE